MPGQCHAGPVPLARLQVCVREPALHCGCASSYSPPLHERPRNAHTNKQTNVRARALARTHNATRCALTRRTRSCGLRRGLQLMHTHLWTSPSPNVGRTGWNRPSEVGTVAATQGSASAGRLAPAAASRTPGNTHSMQHTAYSVPQAQHARAASAMMGAKSVRTKWERAKWERAKWDRAPAPTRRTRP